MDFLTLFRNLNKVKEVFPLMRWEAEYVAWGESKVVITIPVTDENAQLLLDAQKMFAPREDRYGYEYQERDEPPF